MGEELQELRELVAQLRADNERLRQEQNVNAPGPSSAAPTTAMVNAPVTE